MLRQLCSARGVPVSAQELAVWRRRHAVVEHIESYFGEELRRGIACGTLVGRLGPAVQAALSGRCDVSREQARVWAAAF
eukprot:15481904-Alexandrium_andersonii.AAC.1